MCKIVVDILLLPDRSVVPDRSADCLYQIFPVPIPQTPIVEVLVDSEANKAGQALQNVTHK